MCERRQAAATHRQWRSGAPPVAERQAKPSRTHLRSKGRIAHGGHAVAPRTPLPVEALLRAVLKLGQRAAGGAIVHGHLYHISGTRSHPPESGLRATVAPRLPGTERAVNITGAVTPQRWAGLATVARCHNHGAVCGAAACVDPRAQAWTELAKVPDSAVDRARALLRMRRATRVRRRHRLHAGRLVAGGPSAMQRSYARCHACLQAAAG